MEFDEQHANTGLNHFSLTGNKRLICLHKIQEQKVLPIGKLYIVECTRTLFLIYINDLPYGIYHTAKPITYAQDTSVYIAYLTVSC
jgi:hypothetical protein